MRFLGKLVLALAGLVGLFYLVVLITAWI